MGSAYKFCRKFIATGMLLPAITLADDGKFDDAEWRVVVENSESYQLGLQRLRAFGAVNPYLGKEGNSSDLNRECLGLNRQCLPFLRDNPSAAKAALPDNPDYWRNYTDLLAVTPVSRLVEEVKDLDGAKSKVIQATRLWIMREMLIKDTLDVDNLHAHVRAHRRLLSESNFLIDKMIFQATVGISLDGINVLMAQRATKPLDDTETEMLEEMLLPLTRQERSLRRTLRGEYQYMMSVLDETPDPGFDEAALRNALQLYAYVTERSERSWADYWSGGFDIWADVPLHISQQELPSWADYTTNIRHVDVVVYLLRALREIYDGRASPGIPNQPPPARWDWQWRVGAEELCLTPGDIHPSLVRNESPICMQFLDE